MTQADNRCGLIVPGLYTIVSTTHLSPTPIGTTMVTIQSTTIWPERKFQPNPMGSKGIAKPLPAHHQIHGKHKGKQKRW